MPADPTAAERMRRMRKRRKRHRVEKRIYVLEETWPEIMEFAESRGAICPKPKRARAATHDK